MPIVLRGHTPGWNNGSQLPLGFCFPFVSSRSDAKHSVILLLNATMLQLCLKKRSPVDMATQIGPL
jgi:hypothetical protein